MTHKIYASDPKESKHLDSENESFAMANDEVPYPDQFDESEDFIEEDDL